MEADETRVSICTGRSVKRDDGQPSESVPNARGSRDEANHYPASCPDLFRQARTSLHVHPVANCVLSPCLASDPAS